MPLDLWGTVDLMEAQQDQRVAPPDGFWMRYFPTRFNSQAERIYFDQLPDLDRRMAPFVAPHVQGRVMRARGQAMASFTPAYLKPKHNVEPSMAIPRMPGEPLLGNLTLEQRYDRIVADRLRLQREMIERRWDWMAAQAVIFGYVDVAGEDYTPVRVNFNRHGSLTTTLTGTALWSAVGTASPLTDLGASRKNAFQRGKAPVRDFIFGLDAWSAFVLHDEVKRLLDNQFRGSQSEFNTVGLSEGSPVEFQGRIAGPNGQGQMNLWTYSNEYEDPIDSTLKQLLDPRDVVGVGGNIQGVMAFGAIRDKRAGLRAVDMFPKQWEEEDPSETWVMTQSAPLAVPREPNNTFRIRALA